MNRAPDFLPATGARESHSHAEMSARFMLIFRHEACLLTRRPYMSGVRERLASAGQGLVAGDVGHDRAQLDPGQPDAVGVVR